MKIKSCTRRKARRGSCMSGRQHKVHTVQYDHVKVKLGHGRLDREKSRRDSGAHHANEDADQNCSQPQFANIDTTIVRVPVVVRGQEEESLQTMNARVYERAEGLHLLKAGEGLRQEGSMREMSRAWLERRTKA
mmetsp:Transcript_64838/g.114918  ORF Transcript_64838/g.114918 Transcript_64838/m.114918 type:complete len:134 (-) Transcript_64838:31-432(-)